MTTSTNAKYAIVCGIFTTALYATWAIIEHIFGIENIKMDRIIYDLTLMLMRNVDVML